MRRRAFFLRVLAATATASALFIVTVKYLQTRPAEQQNLLYSTSYSLFVHTLSFSTRQKQSEPNHGSRRTRISPAGIELGQFGSVSFWSLSFVWYTTGSIYSALAHTLFFFHQLLSVPKLLFSTLARSTPISLLVACESFTFTVNSTRAS
jgi:hypothetical protein